MGVAYSKLGLCMLCSGSPDPERNGLIQTSRIQIRICSGEVRINVKQIEQFQIDPFDPLCRGWGEAEPRCVGLGEEEAAAIAEAVRWQPRKGGVIVNTLMLYIVFVEYTDNILFLLTLFSTCLN